MTTETTTEIRDEAIESARHLVRRVLLLEERIEVRDWEVMVHLDAAAAEAQWIEMNLLEGDFATILRFLPSMIAEWQQQAFAIANRKTLNKFDLSTLHAFATDLLDLERKVRDLAAATR